MKPMALLLSAVFVSSTAALGQGKIRFDNDSLHIVYYDPSGVAVDSAHMPAGVTLLADLYVGTASATLSLISSTTFSSIPGLWNPVNTVVPGILGGTSVFVVAQVRDAAYAPESVWTPLIFPMGVYGASVEFSLTLGAGVLYPSMTSSWPVGPYPLDQYGVGSRGAIAIPIPEVSSGILAGMALLLVWFMKTPNRLLMGERGYYGRLSRSRSTWHGAVWVTSCLSGGAQGLGQSGRHANKAL